MTSKYDTEGVLIIFYINLIKCDFFYFSGNEDCILLGVKGVCLYHPYQLTLVVLTSLDLSDIRTSICTVYRPINANRRSIYDVLTCMHILDHAGQEEFILLVLCKKKVRQAPPNP